ncbi:MAG: hypothetical protein R2881_03250 [Eubacteriales bacterium]
MRMPARQASSSARCPIVLVSRADPADAKLTSLALGAIAAYEGGKA